MQGADFEGKLTQIRKVGLSKIDFTRERDCQGILHLKGRRSLQAVQQHCLEEGLERQVVMTGCSLFHLRANSGSGYLLIQQDGQLIIIQKIPVSRQEV